MVGWFIALCNIIGWVNYKGLPQDLWENRLQVITLGIWAKYKLQKKGELECKYSCHKYAYNKHMLKYLNKCKFDRLTKQTDIIGKFLQL